MGCVVVFRSTGYPQAIRGLAWIVFVPLQVLWLPISIVGSAVVGIRQLFTSRRLGVSQTAVEIINGRWAMDIFGVHDRMCPEAGRYGAWLRCNNAVFTLRDCRGVE